MAKQLIDFLLKFGWQDWLTVGGFLFGIVTLIAYIEQRRSTKGAAKIIKWVELNLDKSISEEEIKRLLAQKSVMEEQIEKNIPALARVAVLKEQAELHREAIAVHFSAWQKLTSEIESADPVPGLDEQIQNAILDRIVPRYEREQEVKKLRTRITVLSIAAATTSTMLPFGLGSILAIMLAPALISTALRLYALSEERNEVYKSLRPWFHFVYGVFAFIVIGFGVLLFSLGDVKELGIVLAYLACGFGIVLILSYPWLRSRIDKWIASLLSADKAL